MFTSEGDENILSDKSKTVPSANKGLLSDQSTENLSSEKQIKSYKNNIIPASIDVPPPISTVCKFILLWSFCDLYICLFQTFKKKSVFSATKPKSAIDDLFGDADSDDIFLSKNTVKTTAKNKFPNNNNNNNQSTNTESAQKKYLEIVAPTLISNVATSTPETNVNTTDLLNVDEDDDLFGSSKNQPPSKKVRYFAITIFVNQLEILHLKNFW